ncbi:radical SAM protein [Hominisplanchenecus murintestinalis]|uniref:Radical SAM protein n=1 Tax=Hominisplanchenecus murintestinalis TaxID=2941517 RepID=A0AC61QXQ8_9FIRM|nr:radical SAM protein [Hominisplanchenecus murintestinalis]TGX97816.1 radical SAM protein [Hominisplanchenecus murintestinalis]
MHYTGTIWRPPYEAYSLLIQVTAGCTHHSCKFCTLYEDLPFKFKLSPFSEIEQDLAEASKYYHKVPRIFFTGANPFVLNTEKLKALAKMVKEYYPKYETIGCFARITDITPKTVEELRELRALGYDGITIGVETGDDEMLAFMNKGFQSKDTIEQCKKLEAANISYNFFYLTGISGAGRAEIGAKETAKVFNQLHPRIIESSMLTIYKNSELYEEIQKGNWREESEIEKLIELKILIENLKITTRIVTDGASNLIQVRGNLPKDKEKLMKHLQYQISNVDESVLREYRVNLRHL